MSYDLNLKTYHQQQAQARRVNVSNSFISSVKDAMYISAKAWNGSASRGQKRDVGFAYNLTLVRFS